MKRFFCSLIAITTIALCAAEETATPIFELSLPDLDRTRERLKDGPLGTIWNLPESAPLRARLDVAFKNVVASGGIDPWDIASNLVQATLSFGLVAGKSNEPSLAVTARLPKAIESAWPILEKEAVKSHDYSLERQGDVIALKHGASIAQTSWKVPGDADLVGRADFDALAKVLYDDEVTGIFAELGLSSLALEGTLSKTGSMHTLDMPGLRLPLRALDEKSLERLPANPLVAMAIGLDGKRLAEVIDHIAAVSTGFATAVAQANQRLAAVGLPDLTEICKGIDGTFSYILTMGSPLPNVIVTFPANETINTVVAALAAQSGISLEGVDTQSIPIALNAGFWQPYLRRTGQEWIVSTDMAFVDQWASGKSAGFKLVDAEPQQGQRCAYFSQNGPESAKLVAAYLPMGVAAIPDPDIKAVFFDIQKSLTAAAPHIASSSIMVRSDDKGLRAKGENLIFSIAPQAFLAGLILPSLTMVRANANRTASGNNIRQIVASMIAYEQDTGKGYPPDLEELAKQMTLPQNLFRSRGAPAGVSPHYFYVRPEDEPSSEQPVIIENPACNGGKGSMIGFADGSVRFIKAPKAQQIWQEAQRLAALPEAQTTGITLDQWSAVKELLK